MRVIVDIDDDLYTRLFDNGVDNYNDAVDMAKAICKGTPQQPCDDCVSREEVMKLLGKEDWADTVYGVMNLSSVTPTRPKSKWIHWTDDYKDYVTCSCCGYGEEGEVLLSDKTPFCPICGADMRGDTE